MNHVVRQIASSLHKKQINESDVDEDLIEKCLYTRHSPALDLLIRTSGEVRLSDFLLWQSSYTTIYFSKVLWPEFSLKDLCLAILHYQKNVPMIQEALKTRNQRPAKDRVGADRVKHFLDEIEREDCQFRKDLLS